VLSSPVVIWSTGVSNDQQFHFLLNYFDYLFNVSVQCACVTVYVYFVRLMRNNNRLQCTAQGECIMFNVHVMFWVWGLASCDCMNVLVMLLKVLSEASLQYESGLQQRGVASSSTSATACSGAVAAAGAARYTDAWEKFSLDGDSRPTDPHPPVAVESIKESSSQL